jgi:hypothetical protein
MIPVKIFTFENERFLRYFLSELGKLQDEGIITWASQGEF